MSRLSNLRRTSAAAMLLLAAVLQQAQAQSASAETVSVSRELLARTDWVKDAQRCPVEVMAQRESRDHLKGNVCTPGRLASCLSRCSEGEAGACYWLGYELQQGHAESSVSELLYQRSCRLGIASGCTNRAAGQLADHPNDAKAQACAAQTFAKTCSLDDPWGCTMYGFHLSRGIGVAQDRQLALKVLNKSCRYGTDDPACSSGMRLKDELQGKSTEERPGQTGQVRPKSQTSR